MEDGCTLRTVVLVMTIVQWMVVMVLQIDRQSVRNFERR